MYGWHGRILRVDLTKKKALEQKIDGTILANFLGGRGLAVYLLWNDLPPGIDPYSPHNELIISTGPLTGLPGPSTSKLVIASKSPLTNGYGDGNIGSKAAIQLKWAGYDAIVIMGKAEKPTYLYIEDDKVSFLDARDLWGLDTFSSEEYLIKQYGNSAGILLIGPAGENLVRYATVISMKGRSGGRPGMGAVMGSKLLKAIVIRGKRGAPSLANPKEFQKVAVDAMNDIKNSKGYDFWIREGTMATIEWGQENSVLPTQNFREGVFDEYMGISGRTMEEMKVERRGCPTCNMQCGNVILDSEGKKSELDYENVAILGSNILLGGLKRVAELNRLVDMYGMDTISTGSSIAFLMESSEKKIIPEKIEWGDFEAAKQLIEDTAYRRGLGNLMAEGTMRMSWYLRNVSEDWAIHVKGLETSAYDCHSAPGMALAFGTSPIGAHHKDAWLIGVEVKMPRDSYDITKVNKLIEMQRIRGGAFESFTTCRLPWVELGLSFDYYPKLLSLATGLSYNLDEIFNISDRIYALIRAFWIREFRGWSKYYDYPPNRWFKEPLTKGPYKGMKLDPQKYDGMLMMYYKIRGWDENGVPTRETFKKLGLDFVIPEIEKYVELH
ncbi:MAG: aldehyde ferredoxin oxidoreductase family protein [Sulfolobus sp.]|nr:aldehyde ferredoxin oxidoreductase family protein [Sulfolobus sp.]